VNTVVADELAEQAERLLEMWCSLALQHVALGSACACGAGGVSLRLEDFELDIVDYLQDGGERCEHAEVSQWFRARQGMAATHQPLRRLLEAVQTERMPEPVVRWMLARLERTLSAFAEMHGPGSSVRL
jgi:hypothetical protein